MLIISGIAKFSLDFFRNSHIGLVLSVNQLLCLLFIAIGIISLLKKRKEIA